MKVQLINLFSQKSPAEVFAVGIFISSSKTLFNKINENDHASALNIRSYF